MINIGTLMIDLFTIDIYLNYMRVYTTTIIIHTHIYTDKHTNTHLKNSFN